MRHSYTVLVKPSAEKEMDRLPSSVFDRITAAILKLASEPRPRGCRKLRGRDEYRLRCGDYRILYAVDDDHRVVEIMSVGHRREVYRDL